MASFKYAITGSTGWLGKELIFSLLDRGCIQSLDEILLYSSTERLVDFGKFGKKESFAFLGSDFSEISEVEYFVHLSFLTRNLVQKYGLNRYIQINQNLTNQAVNFIERTQPLFVSSVSSGAVYSQNSHELENDIQRNPYGFLKVREEELLREICTIHSSNLSIGRLWGATGRYMPVNVAYAISDLIVQALTKKSIQIHSPRQVFRRYCDSSEFLRVLLECSTVNEFNLFDSGGPLIEIKELATRIMRELDIGGNIEQNLDVSLGVDDYYARSDSFEVLANGFGVSISGISDQIKRTIAGHKIQLCASGTQ
jgi:nucleoside-diphosphate-sugar epimerase